MNKPVNRRHIAVIDISEDVIDALSEGLKLFGYKPLGIHLPQAIRGQWNVTEMLDSFNAGVVICEVPFPYQQHWDYFKSMRADQANRKRRFIVTTTEKTELEHSSDFDPSIKVFRKPFSLTEIMEEIRTESTHEPRIKREKG